jgi:hypothetical protein
MSGKGFAVKPTVDIKFIPVDCWLRVEGSGRGTEGGGRRADGRWKGAKKNQPTTDEHGLLTAEQAKLRVEG